MHTHTPASARLAVVDRPAPPTSALIRSVLAATLVAAVLRLFRLGHQSLWVDEIFTWQSAGGGATLGWRELVENVHGPLFSLALHAWMRIAGESEWALRAPSALAGVLTVPALAWLARRWTGRETVVPAAWLAAGSPFLVWYAQECRSYAWLVLWAVVSVAAVLELQRRASATGFARAVVALAAGLLTSGEFLLLAPFQLRLWLGGDRATRRPRMIALAVAAVLLVLLALPFVPQVARTWDWSRLALVRTPRAGETGLRGNITFHPAAVPYALHAFAVGYTLGPSLRELKLHPGMGTVLHHAGELAATGVVFGALAVLGLVALARRRRLADTFLWFVAPVLLVSYFASHNFKVFHPRYFAVSLPCLLLACAAALADLRPAFRRLFGVGIAALWCVSLYHHYFVAEYAREDYRGAMAAVRAGFAPGEQVLAVGSEDPVEFYGRGLRVGRWWLGYAATPDRMAERFDEAASSATGTWVVLSRAEDLDPGDRFATWLGSRYPHADHVSFHGVRIWHVAAQDRSMSPPADRLATPAR